MSHETSPSTHRPYGIARVTRVWQVPRSTVYAQRNRRARPTPVAKRGPKPPQSDAELTAAVRAVIAASPFHGEGHRKIWARLRVQGLRTSKRRTLVVMRAADLLGPARLPTPVAARPHDGTIVTASPNVMWGTDATATVTLADGHVTIFGAIDHCTAECVGLHAAKYGTRFEALEPVRQGVRDHFGTMAAGVASGLTMRHDHGSQYMSNDFHAELRFLGIVSSPAFVRQPEGNGCIERFFRTLKEQLLWVRHFTDVEDLQQALRTFKETYNQQWLIERLGFRAPAVVRRAFALTTAAGIHSPGCPRNPWRYNRPYREARGVVIDPDTHPAFVAMQIVDAIRNGLPARGGGGRDHEVVDLYPLRRLRRAPGAARVLERADQLLLLGVHRNRRLLLPLRASHAPGDVPKLRVPIDMLAALTSLGVALQAVAQSVQQLGDHRVADAVAQTVERHRQRPCALARPPQRRVGIAGGGRLDQRIQIAQQRRVEIDRALAAAARPSRPAARERLVRRQFTQTALDGRCRDTRGSGDQRRAAIPDRLGLSRRPHPARSLREHGRQRCMLCPQGSQLHGRSVLLADQQYKQLFPYSILAEAVRNESALYWGSSPI